jgi:hypothetical protein
MTTITKFRTAMQTQLQQMQGSGLYVVDIPKDTLWDVYLDSFPEGTNEVYKERREYDCNCCKQFIKVMGGLVTIIDGKKLTSIWDISVGGYYQEVADAMATLVEGGKIQDKFLHYQERVGTEFNYSAMEDGVKEWEHLAGELGTGCIFDKDRIATSLAETRSNKEVFQRSLDEITLDAAETVLELIAQKSLYRGEEHKGIVTSFARHLKVYSPLSETRKDLFCWSVSAKLGGASKIRNTVIGSLLSDLSEGKALDVAVRSFELKVAPSNYKRPTALVTKGMISNAQAKVKELDIEDSLPRRYATAEDLTVNNLLFVNRDTKKQMNAFDELMEEATTRPKNLEKVEEVSIGDFINNVVPKATGIEVMVDNSHANNFMSLIAPVHADAKNILKWENNFSWAYNGDVTDSMKDRVKSAGGNVDGVLRFSIQWNEKGDNNNDLDAHCYEPGGKHIYFSNKGTKHGSSGMLDVDIVSPNGKVAVENIVYTDLKRMPEGDYEFKVHNYSERGGSGFTAEIEFDGKVYSYNYPKKIRESHYVAVATVNFTRKGGLTLQTALPHSETVKEVWGVKTQNFQKVNMVMNSPNHWDGNEIGNKHWFFIIEGCKQEGASRGIFNEFLSQDLNEHRKVFEVLGSKMKTDKSDNQLSGLGFSSTQRNSVYLKVKGTFERTIKVNF